MQLLAVLVLAAASIRGDVGFEGPVPGCIVRLTSSEHGERNTITDVEGTYRFAAVQPGEYALLIKLDGVSESTRIITVVADTELVIPHEELKIDESKVVTANCAGGDPCSESTPRFAWDEPVCADYQLDTILLEAIAQNDASAIALARSRFRAATTYLQKNRLAAALLRRVANDSEYWNELHEHARNSIRFGGQTPAFEEWCAQQQLPPENYWPVAVHALSAAGQDPRGRSMLLDALQVPEFDVLYMAVGALAFHRDEPALPAIGKALEANPDHASTLAMLLGMFDSDAADEIAYRFLDEDSRENYTRDPRD